mmetsp:Transcript_39561/g.117689  ORF Transcript_39561/g.117689 Transcript_39561/m.117689 type:complete len:268 (-) Transcript_39561:163-966(-)
MFPARLSAKLRSRPSLEHRGRSVRHTPPRLPAHGKMSATMAETGSEAGSELRRLCVFCGSSMGTKPEYAQAATALGRCMVDEKLGLVYGGGTIGLMGVIAKTVLEGLGGENIIGVIPESLKPKELSGEMIGQLEVTPDMHTRKALMARKADGFIAMPGGFGTLEELLEVITWQQLGFHNKPIGVLNANGFFDPLLHFFTHSVQEGFIRQQHNTVIVSADPAELIRKMREFKPSKSLLQMMSEQAARDGPDGISVAEKSTSAQDRPVL